jgi:hypothetical protein
VVLVFDKELAAKEGRERGVGIGGCAGQVAAYHRAGSNNVVIGRVLHGDFLPPGKIFFAEKLAEGLAERL